MRSPLGFPRIEKSEDLAFRSLVPGDSEIQQDLPSTFCSSSLILPVLPSFSKSH